MLGQGIAPNNYNPMTATLKEPELSQEVTEIEKSITFLVDNLPTHKNFIQRYCPAAP